MRDATKDAAPTLIERLTEFEEFAHAAADQSSTSGDDDAMYKTLFVTGYKWDLAAVYNALVKTLDTEHLRRVIDAAMDAKLQLMYLTDLRMGMADYEWFLERSNERAKKPQLFRLRSLAQLQDEITKIRVFWERFMIFVYALETGETLHDMKKIKAKFFKEMERHTHWNWLLPYEEEIERFDAKYRTAELHKASVLRAKLFDADGEFHNEILRLLNLAMNQVWDNTFLIVQGVRDPRRFSYGMAHIGQDQEIDINKLTSGKGFSRKRRSK